MAVQPARIAQADLRHLPMTPRLRSSPSVRIAASAAVTARPHLGPARPAGHAIRAAAITPWASVAPAFRSRLRPAAVILAVIIVGTMLGLVYVTQVLAAENARYAVDRLLVERQALMRSLGSQEATIVEWGSEAQVTRWSQDQGLDRLGMADRVRGR